MNDFIKQRDQYIPDSIKLIVILESPPSSGMYIYNDRGKATEPLFRILMKTFFSRTFETKKDGLKSLQLSGIFLLNPIYSAVDHLKDKDADDLILANYEIFKTDLQHFNRTKKVPLVLVKANIWKLFAHRLTDEGYLVLNKEHMLPYPVHYHEKVFVPAIRHYMNVAHVKPNIQYAVTLFN